MTLGAARSPECHGDLSEGQGVTMREEPHIALFNAEFAQGSSKFLEMGRLEMRLESSAPCIDLVQHNDVRRVLLGEYIEGQTTFLIGEGAVAVVAADFEEFVEVFSRCGEFSDDCEAFRHETNPISFRN